VASLSELPPALRPWQASLSLFPRDLALSLGPLVQRLALAVGPLRGRDRANAGEPDGYRDIGRRGTYERLLVSEWLLADELPDEFLRRATSGEHLFLQRAHRKPAGTRGSVALFDAGPSQLGAPRVAHVAALVILASRAAAAGVPFAFGILQQPGKPLAEVNPQSVLALLDARTAEEASLETLARHIEQLGDGQALDDLWLVAGERCRRLPVPPTASLLLVEEPIEPHSRSLVASAIRGGASATVELELPPAADCTRLLRDPFLAATPRPQAAACSASDLLFSQDGRRLLFKVGDRALQAIPLQTGQVESMAPRSVSFAVEPGERILAADWVAKQLLILTLDEDLRRAQLYRFGKRGGRVGVEQFVWPEELPPRNGDGLGILAHAPGLFLGSDLVVLRSPDGALFHFAHENREAIAGPRTLALALVDRSPHYVVHEPSSGYCMFHWQDFTFVQKALGAVCAGEPEAHFSYGQLLALRMGPGQWRLMHLASSRSEDLHLTARVVGAADLGGPSLVVVEDDEHSFSVVGRRQSRSLPQASGRIVEVALASTAPWLAYATAEGEVVVLNLSDGRPLYRRAPPVDP
jgi:hypothetical protein